MLKIFPKLCTRELFGFQLCPRLLKGRNYLNSYEKLNYMLLQLNFSRCVAKPKFLYSTNYILLRMAMLLLSIF